MIELNLLEKRKPFVVPTVMGVNPRDINIRMLIVAGVFWFLPDMLIVNYFDPQIESKQSEFAELVEKSKKIKDKVSEDKSVKGLLSAYKEQVEKLKQRSGQVDEILKARTNPKKLLEKIARSVPDELWIEKLNIKENNEIQIIGGAENSRAIGEFITLINDSPYFGGTVSPVKQESKKDTVNGIVYASEFFELKGKIINYEMGAN